MTDLRFLVLGDDFTPASLFEETIRARLSGWAGALSFHCVDSAPCDFSAVGSEEISEAFGDIAEVARLARSCHVIVTTFAPVTAAVLDQADNLLAIACGRGGPVNINVAAATERGVPVLYAPGRNVQAVAEFTLAGMINLMRQLPRALTYARDGSWTTPREDTFEKPSGPELASRTLGLIGCGHVGRLVGKLAAAFGTRVLGCDPYADRAALRDVGIELVPLPRLLVEADVISVHARVAKGEDPLLGAAEFAAMAKRPYLVNTARAAALDYDALLDALARDRVAAALLDVYPDEPLPPESPLLAVDPARLHLTPHAAGVSRDIPGNTARILADGLARLLAGERPDHVMNEEALDSCFGRIRTC